MSDRTIVREAAEAAQVEQTRGIYGATNFGSPIMPEDAFERAGGRKFKYEEIPLAGVDSEGNIVVPANKINMVAVRQTAPHEYDYGAVATEDVLYHREAIRNIQRYMLDDEDNPYGADAIIIGNRGQTMMVDLPYTVYDVKGDEISQHIIAFSNLFTKSRSSAGVAILDVPVYCTNQIVSLQMAANSNGFILAGKNRFGKSAGGNWGKKSGAELHGAMMEHAHTYLSNNPGRTQRIYEAFTRVPLIRFHDGVQDDTRIHNLLNRIFERPRFPSQKHMETHSAYRDRLDRWRKRIAEIEATHERILHILENGTGTMDTKVRSEKTAYSFLQAVTEDVSKNGGNGDWGHARSIMSGRSKTVITRTIDECLNMCQRDGIQIEW